MSSNSYEDLPIVENKDAFLYMMLRRIINGEYAQVPVDFNVASLEVGETFFGRPLTSDDVIVDIGSSSGEMMTEAAITVGTMARVICVEPSAQIAQYQLFLPEEYRERTAYIRAIGEQTPFADNVAKGVTMHNVIFRAQDSGAMLTEAKRIVEPGGFIAISSNGRDHARFRHAFEKQVALHVQRDLGIDFDIPEPPAEGHYLDNLPELVASVGELQIMDQLEVVQYTKAIIYRGARLDNYLDSIEYSAANTGLPYEHYSTWRKWVTRLVSPLIEAQIKIIEEQFKEEDIKREPYFGDPIQRGMIVIRNDKTA